MVALTKQNRADIELQVRRENLAIKYAERLEPKQNDKAAWQHLAQHYGHKEMQIQGLNQPDMRTDLITTISLETFPCTKQGFMDYLEQCRNAARERMDANESAKVWTPTDDRPRVCACWRICHPKQHYYRLLSNTNPGEFYATTPEVVTALEALLPSPIAIGAVKDLDIEVTWITNRDGNGDNYPKVYRQIVAVKKPELSDEDLIDLTDIVEAIGVDKFADVPDFVTDAMTLDGLRLRGWLGFQRNKAGGGIQYKVFPKTAKKAGILEMVNIQVQLQQLFADLRDSAGMPRTPTYNDSVHTLSAILQTSTVSAFFANGGTYNEAEKILRAHFDPLIEAHEKAKAEQPPSELDKQFPRDENNQPVEPDADATLPNKTPEKKMKPAGLDNAKFFGKLNGQLNKYDQWRKLTNPAKTDFVHGVIGHVHECTLDIEDAVDKCKDAYIDLLNDQPATPKQQTSPKTENQQEAIKKAEISTEAKSEGKTSESMAQKQIGQQNPVNPPNKNGGAEKLIASPLLEEIKTLKGIPVGKIGRYLNKPHAKVYYESIKAKKKGEEWTDLDPVAVRKRFDKVFGPQGFGWRIVPIEGVSRVVYLSVESKYSDGSTRAMHSASLEGFAFEYALVSPDGSMFYVRTTPFSDNHVNDDQGSAYRGALTSIMKQALKMFGGFDHFMDKAPEVTDDIA